METFKIVTIIITVAYAIAWIAISIRLNAMYIAPIEINAFMVSVVSGKVFESFYKAKGRN